MRKTLSRAEELALVIQAKAGDRSAMGALVAAHKPFIQCMMRQITYPEWLDQADVLQEGCIGLMEAVHTFDVNSGNKLLTHAYWKIKKSLTVHMNKMGYMVSMPFLKLLDLKKHLNRMDQMPHLVTEEDIKKFATFKNFQLLALSIGMCSFEAPSFKQFTNQQQASDSDDDWGNESFVTSDVSLIARSTEDDFVSRLTQQDILDVISKLPAIQGILLSQYLGVYAADQKHSLKALVGQKAEFDEAGNFAPGFNGYGVQVGKSYNTISKLVRSALKQVRGDLSRTMGDALADMGIQAHETA